MAQDNPSQDNLHDLFSKAIKTIVKNHEWRSAFINDVLFGLAFGLGFAIAANVLNFIGQFFHAH